jgi:hypothetical protein
VVGNFVVFVGSLRDGNPTQLASVYVLNAASGDLLYTVPMETDSWQPLMPTLVEDPATGSVTAFCVDHSTVFAVSLGPTSGSVLWSQVSLIGGYGMPTVVGKSVILTGPGQYYAFDRFTGAANHFYTSNTYGGGGTTVAYDASRRQFYIVEDYGDEGTETLSAYHYTDNDHIDLLWQQSGEGVWGGAGAALGPNGHVYVAGLPEIIEVDPDSGAILGRIVADCAAGMTPAISNGVLWAFSYWEYGPTKTYAFDLGTRQLIRTLPGSRGSVNTPYDGPGGICDNHFLLDLGTGFVVYAAAGPVHLSSAVSLMNHGAAGTFGVNLPLTGSPGVEGRSGGPNGNFTVSCTFTNALRTVGGANIVSGTGSVAASGIDPNDPHNYIVNLTGVTNEQTITVTLTSVTDVQGGSSAVLSVPMGTLLGDVNGDGFVNAGDIARTKSESGNSVTSSNFGADVNANGAINAADIALVRSQSGTGVGK